MSTAAPRAALGFLRATARVALLAPLHTLKGRRLFGLGLLVMLPVLIALILRANDASRGLGVRGFMDVTTMIYFAVIFPLTALFLGGAALGDDIDNGTVLYLRMRPIPLASIVCGRFLAAAFSAFVLLAPALIALYLVQVSFSGLALLASQWRLLAGALLAALLASIAYCALFLALSLLLRMAVVLGLLLTMLGEAISRLPSSAANFTPSFHLSVLMSRFTDEGADLRGRLQGWVDLGIALEPRVAVAWMLGFAAVGLAIACFVFTRREYMEKPGEN